MQIIDYFACNDKTHWRSAIAENEWRAAKHLARLLEQGNFHDEVGKGTVYLLTEGDKLVSFLTLAERDCVDVPYGPWIGFVHTAPEYRGHRHVGKLIDHACAAAREQGGGQGQRQDQTHNLFHINTSCQNADGASIPQPFGDKQGIFSKHGKFLNLSIDLYQIMVYNGLA